MPGHDAVLQQAAPRPMPSPDPEELGALLKKIHGERGVDFQEYRESTVRRRLRRRLRARGVRTFSEYGEVLDRDPAEYDRLFDDLTINVTTFFRDEVAFRALEEIALPALREKDRQEGSPIRIWSAGCATGAEPYSIAMLLEEMDGSAQVELLATDLDPKVLKRAREGRFTNKEMADVPLAWRDKHFAPRDRGFEVRPSLRERVTFARHDLVSDPFYRELDLVVCRNVLIYFTAPLQERVLRQVWEGLNVGGFLLLGRMELPMQETKKRFEPVDRAAKLFRRIDRPGNAGSP